MRLRLIVLCLCVTQLAACDDDGDGDGNGTPPPDAVLDAGPAPDGMAPMDAEPGPEPDPDPDPDPVEQPNLLLVIVDDVGVDNISAYGEHADSAHTPTIDDLAADGVLFRNAWVNPQCSPTRASVYTGRHAFRHGIGLPAGASLDADEETIAETLKPVGYATALFGKWHLGTRDESLPTNQGFDYYSGNTQSGVADYFDWLKLTLDGASSAERQEDRYATSVAVDEALDWLDGRDEPWMLTLSFNAPHGPFHVPPANLHRYPGLDAAEGTICSRRGDSPPTTDCYRAMMEAADTELGRLLDTLDASGVLDDTVVVVLGDNGTDPQAVVDDGVFVSNHAKTTVYEGGVNVPLIVYGPRLGVRQGVEVGALVQGLDLFATLRDLGGGTSSPGITVDARSLAGYLFDDVDQPADRPFLYTEAFSTRQDLDQWAISDGTVKFIYEDGAVQCFDLSADPGENTDLYAAGGDFAAACDALAAQRPCLAEDACP